MITVLFIITSTIAILAAMQAAGHDPWADPSDD